MVYFEAPILKKLSFYGAIHRVIYQLYNAEIEVKKQK